MSMSASSTSRRTAKMVGSIMRQCTSQRVGPPSPTPQTMPST